MLFVKSERKNLKNFIRKTEKALIVVCHEIFLKLIFEIVS